MSYDANITGFFPKSSEFTVQSSEQVRVISDPEGYHIRQLANDNPTTKLVVLGDLFDYTLGRGSNFNNFATGELTALREAKSHSFESAKYCVDNKDRIKVMFGNRDLNKLKLMPLSLITNKSDNKYVKYWNPPKNDYYSGAIALVELLRSENYNWAIPQLNNWKPFWSGFENRPLCSHWNQNNPRLGNQPEKMSCLERYYLIFGLDCEQGTMSGQNTIFGVAQECGVYSKLFGAFTGVLSQFKMTDSGKKELLNDNNFLLNIDNPELKKNLEIAAALVFVVFADALYGDKPTTEKPFSGILREFFLADNTYYCAYAKMDKDLLTFSHGGMRAEFFTCPKPEGQKLTDLVTQNAGLVSMIAEQLGGYVGQTKVKPIAESDVIKRITEYNTEMKAGLAKLIDEYIRYIDFPNKVSDKATLELLLNLTISAPHNGSPNSCIHQTASPIMPGVSNAINGGYRANPIVVSGTTLYQFIGHAPTGYAPLIDKYTEAGNGGVSYLVNLDISNSLMGQYGLLDMSTVATNYSYVSIGQESGELKFKSNTNIKLQPQTISNMASSNISDIKIVDCNLLDLPAEFEKHNIQSNDTKGNPIPYNYHGAISYQGRTYYLFTYVIGWNPPSIYLVPTNKLSALVAKFNGKGGKSYRRRNPKSKQTGKKHKGAKNKLYVRTSRTLVRRRANRRTAKK